MLIKLSLKNIRKTFDRLPIFFLSVSFAIMVSFIFYKIGTNESFIQRLNSNRDMGYEAGAWLVLTSSFISFFLLLFILYSNNFFMKRMRKDISILLISGFSRIQVGFFYLIQQFILGISLFIVGNLLGVIFTRLFLMFLLKLMSFPIEPIIGLSSSDFKPSIFIFGIILILVWINTLYHVFQTKTNFNSQQNYHYYAKSEFTFIRQILGFVSVIILLLDLYLVVFKISSDAVIGQSEVFAIIFGIIFGGPVGVYGLFKWFLPNLFTGLKKIPFISDQQLIWMSNVGNTFRKSSFVLTIISVISILALGIFSILSTAYPFRQEAVQINSPTDLTINTVAQTEVEQLAQKYQYDLVAGTKINPKIISAKGDVWTFIPLSSYNEFWQTLNKRSKKISLKKDEAVLLTDHKFSVTNSEDPINFLNQVGPSYNLPKLKIEKSVNKFPMGRLMYAGDAFVVNDSTFKEMSSDYQYELLSYQINPKEDSETLTNSNWNKFSTALNNLLIDGQFDNLVYLKVEGNNISVSDNYVEDATGHIAKINFSSISNTIFKQIIGLAVFIFLFLAILLVLSSGNLLVLRLQNDLYENLQDFIIYRKLGATKKELLKILRNQTMLIFFAPMCIALITIFAFLPSLALILNSTAYLIFGTVIVCYIVLNIIFYVIAYHDFSTVISSSILERRIN